jgi:hypothetical protein
MRDVEDIEQGLFMIFSTEREFAQFADRIIRRSTAKR